MTEYYFFGANPNKKCSHCYPRWQEIHINILELFEQQLQDKIPFEKAFSEIVSHEFLHALMYNLEGWNASTWIDTLSNGKLKSKGQKFSIKDWHGGIYSYKEVKE